MAGWVEPMPGPHPAQVSCGHCYLFFTVILQALDVSGRRNPPKYNTPPPNITPPLEGRLRPPKYNTPRKKREILASETGKSYTFYTILPTNFQFWHKFLVSKTIPVLKNANFP